MKRIIDHCSERTSDKQKCSEHRNIIRGLGSELC